MSSSAADGGLQSGVRSIRLTTIGTADRSSAKRFGRRWRIHLPRDPARIDPVDGRCICPRRSRPIHAHLR